MKRFYKLVSTSKVKGGHAVQLDGRSLKTPGGQEMVIEVEALAERVASEWREQADEINADLMPFTQLVITAIDRVHRDRKEIEDLTLAYLNTDLLCYQVEEPEELAMRQKKLWGAWLDWFEREYGIELEVTNGLAALTQPEEAHKKAKDYVGSLDDYQFTVFQLAVSLTGSFVMALAFMREVVGPDELFDVHFLEEQHKAEIYNEDKHGVSPTQKKKQDHFKNELTVAREFLGLLS